MNVVKFQEFKFLKDLKMGPVLASQVELFTILTARFCKNTILGRFVLQVHPKLDYNSISMEVSLNCIKFEENKLREKTQIYVLLLWIQIIYQLIEICGISTSDCRLQSHPKTWFQKHEGKAARLWKHEIQTTAFFDEV